MKKREKWKERHYDNVSLLRRLLKNRIVDPITDCWISTSRTSTGYGIIRFNHHGHISSIRLHRLIAWLFLSYNGDSALEVCHRCNVKACFNPDHLYLATHQQNMADAQRDGLWKLPRGRRKQVAAAPEMLQ